MTTTEIDARKRRVNEVLTRALEHVSIFRSFVTPAERYRLTLLTMLFAPTDPEIEDVLWDGPWESDLHWFRGRCFCSACLQLVGAKLETCESCGHTLPGILPTMIDFAGARKVR